MLHRMKRSSPLFTITLVVLTSVSIFVAQDPILVSTKPSFATTTNQNVRLAQDSTDELTEFAENPQTSTLSQLSSVGSSSNLPVPLSSAENLAVAYSTSSFNISKNSPSESGQTSSVVKLSDRVAQRMNESTLHLYRSLLSISEPAVLPVTYPNKIINVGFRFKIYELLDISETQQSMILLLSVKMVWHDQFLVWNDTDFAHVDHLHFEHNKIWTPPIILENTQSNSYKYIIEDYQILVKSNGEATMSNLILVTGACTIKVRMFPFDEQRCQLRFNSRGYTENQLRKEFLDADMFQNYNPSSEWIIFDVNQSKQMYLEADNDQFLVYELFLKRRSTTYVVNLVMPNIILTLMTGIQFILPAETGEKMSIGITTLLALTFFLSIVSDKLPASAVEVPIITYFFSITIIMSAASIIVTVCNLKLFYKDDPDIQPPRWVQRFFLKHLARIFCVTTKFTLLAQKRKKQTFSTARLFPSPVSKLLRTRSTECVVNSVTGGGNTSSSRVRQRSTDRLSPVHGDLSSETQEMIRIQVNSKDVCNNDNAREADGVQEQVENGGEYDEDEEAILMEGGDETWRDLSVVLDRICFIIFVIVATTTTVATFGKIVDIHDYPHAF